MSESAIASWRQLLGDAHVQAPVDDAATFATSQRAIAVLGPGTRDEVCGCVRIAARHGIPLHPISRGKNWGYGSRVPPRDGAAVIDLARLDKIVDFDERLAYVTVEPGVTFAQLAAFLRSTRARVFASVTGGTASGSVLANALERGDGSGPLGDRWGHVCGLEVVLADGEIVQLGSAVQRHAAGPALDGLFSQSALGIVTRATIWLAPYPRKLVLAAWSADALPPIVDALRRLRLDGVTRATTPIWNDLKMLSLLGQYPFDRAQTTPLPPTLRDALRVERGIHRWTGTVSLYGASVAHADVLRELVHAELAEHATVSYRDFPDDPLDADDDACGPALGVPHDRNASAVYWRKRMTVPADPDPDRDRCGFIWLSHALPFDGTHAMRVNDIVEREFADAGFEPSLALLGVTDRALSAVAAIAYDRDVDGEDARAMACHDRVHALLVERGYPPFRTGIHTPPIAREPRYQQLVDDIARALDPRGVFIARR
jgi:4-cresol dehydrogenase (hydroxylating)